jgi:hypothetical protein
MEIVDLAGAELAASADGARGAAATSAPRPRAHAGDIAFGIISCPEQSLDNGEGRLPRT